MSEPVVIVREHGKVMQVVLNRPAKLNALNHDIFACLHAALEEFRERDDLRVMLIRARGRYFCAGADLTEKPVPEMHGSSTKVRSWYRTDMGNRMLALYQEMEALEKPLVVAHHATCVGGGLELSLSCDFRLAAQSAKYVFPEATLGMLPATGGVSRLTRTVGPHWARWLIMANLPMDAEKALIAGLVHAVYPDESFEQDVDEFCRHLAEQPPEVVAMSKLAIELAADLESAQARNLERLANSVLALGQEHDGLIKQMRGKLTKSDN